MFSNSLATTHGMWARVVAGLPQTWGIILYDTRGHGGSDLAPATLDDLGQDAAELIETFAPEGVHMCGLSLGGLTAQWMALNRPDLLHSVVIANSAPVFPPAQMWTDRAAAARDGGMAQFVAPSLERWFTPAFQDAHPKALMALSNELVEMSPEGYACGCEVLAQSDLSAQLGQISLPTDIIAGQHDPSTPVETHKAMADQIPGAELTVLDAAHISAIEADREFSRTLVGHVWRSRNQQGGS
jgi:3-oxoadipate enol-lactonase